MTKDILEYFGVTTTERLIETAEFNTFINTLLQIKPDIYLGYFISKDELNIVMQSRVITVVLLDKLKVIREVILH